MYSCKKIKKSNLKHTSLVKPHIYDYECEYCRYKCYNNAATRFRDKNNNTKKRRRKLSPAKITIGQTPTKTKKHSTASYRDCVLLKDATLLPEMSLTDSTRKNLSKYSQDNLSENVNQLRLCESMQNLCLSPKVLRAYNKVPAHDQKILNRMARNRSRNAELKEYAWLAQKFWENEKYERALLKLEQDEEYRKAVQEKRVHDSEITQARLEALSRREQEERAKLKDTLYVKDERLKARLKNIKLQKSILQCQRTEEELRKSEAALQMIEEQHLNEELRKQDICSRLEGRLSKADNLRQRYQDVYARRLRYDNYMEQVLHEENFEEAKKCESLRMEELKKQIEEKDKRAKEFVESRQNFYQDTIERAKLSASLRDLVRTSVSPVGLNFPSSSSRGGGCCAGGCTTNNNSSRQQFYERPFSNLSFQIG